MRICYIGPVERQPLLQAFVSPGVTVEARWAEGGPASIESMWEEYLEAAALLDLVPRLEAEGFDAVVPGCFGDPGLAGLRELVRIPVVGPGATAILTAANLGHRYGIVCALESDVRPLENLARMSGAGRKLAGVRPLAIPVLSLNGDRDHTFERLVEVGQRLIEQDRADVLILGCGTLSFRAAELQAALAVPVVNPLRVALRTAESLVACGLSHSKRSYPVPPKLALPAAPLSARS